MQADPAVREAEPELDGPREQRDHAGRWLHQAIEVRDPHVIPIQCYPLLAPVREDPRYAALLAKLKMVPGR